MAETQHIPAPPFAHYCGAAHPKILFIGEAWGESEEAYRQPFVGEGGKECFRMLGEAFPDVAPELHAEISQLLHYGFAWIKRRAEWFEAAGIGFTNVLAFRPPNSKLETICGKKAEVGGDNYLFPPVAKGRYLLPEYFGELDRLAAEISELRPNLLVPLGNTACWATLRATNIGSIRGTVARATQAYGGERIKCLPTYHPAGILRQWSWRTIVVADFMKARRESLSAELIRPKRKVLINPSLAEVKQWFSNQIASGKLTLYGADTETEGGQITCIAFAASRAEAICIPIWDKSKPGWSYWTEEEEIEIWDAIQAFMTHPAVSLLWQNGMYDYQYCLPMKLPVHHSTEDTMLLHHSLYPEMQKSLGFLGSLYTNEASWKLMRRYRADTEKRDE